MSDFSASNSHAQNIKVSVDKILGQTTSLRKAKKSQDDKRRLLFKRIIEGIEGVNDRSYMLEENLDMNMESYNAGFFMIIDELLELHFTHQQVKLINFYLYDRYNADGTICELYDEDDELIPLNTPDELYSFLLNMK